jgi:TM2 domain-containing membrane protein YozV
MERNNLVAYLLWFFFGILGIHRFYCGKILSGLIWFFTGGLFLIGWLVDLFMIPSMVKEANEEYRKSVRDIINENRNN